MAIKVMLGANKTQEKPFPKLMICKSHCKNAGMLVFFKENKKGTVIGFPVTHEIGFNSEAWAMQDFEDYNEPITIQNQ